MLLSDLLPYTSRTQVNIYTYSPISCEWLISLLQNDLLDLYQVASISACNEYAIDVRVVPLYLDDFIDDFAYVEDLYEFCLDRSIETELTDISMAEYVKDNCPLSFARYLLDMGYNLDDYKNIDMV